MRSFRLGGALLLGTLLAGGALAGLPIRNDEARPPSVMDRFKRVRGYVPEDVKAVWGRFVESASRHRGSVPRPALLERDEQPKAPDLGDGFLEGFAEERGLRRKLTALSGYLATLGRARRWLKTLPEDQRQPLLGPYGSLDAEARTAEAILVHQLTADLTRGGRALDIVIDHVQRTGYAESTASDAFGGLTRGLKRSLTQVAQEGELDEDRRLAAGEKIQILERLIDG